MSNTDESVSNSNGQPLTQEQIEKTSARLSIPKDEARRLLAKKKLRRDS